MASHKKTCRATSVKASNCQQLDFKVAKTSSRITRSSAKLNARKSLGAAALHHTHLHDVQDPLPGRQKKLATKSLPEEVAAMQYGQSPDLDDEQNYKPESVPKSLAEEAAALQHALSREVPDMLPGRLKQIDELHDLLTSCIKLKKSETVYVYGSVGHGKTASVTSLCSNSQVKDNFKIIFINCVFTNNLTKLYVEIGKNLNKKINSNQISIDEIAAAIDSQRKSVLLILDEVDKLNFRSDIFSFYALFELRLKLKKRQLALIGIGNSGDFFAKKLPLLAYTDIAPKLMEFGAYDINEIKQVLLKRLNSISQNRLLFTEPAVELLARKAADSSDVRRALSLAIRAITCARQNSPEDEVIKINPQTILQVYNNCSKQESIDDSYTLNDKVILCSVLRVLSAGGAKIILQQVFDDVRKVFDDRKLGRISQEEFKNCCDRLERRGVFSIAPKKKKTIDLDHEVVMEWSKSELLEQLRNQEGSVFEKALHNVKFS